jgi:hypothetical protein
VTTTASVVRFAAKAAGCKINVNVSGAKKAGAGLQTAIPADSMIAASSPEQKFRHFRFNGRPAKN